MRIVLPIVAIFVAMFTAAADDALSAYIEAYYSLALVSTITLALLCFLIDTCRSILYAWLPFLHKILTATFVFKKAAIVRAFVLPVVMTAVCLTPTGSVMFFLLTVL
ncbi:J domain-containing protein, partial [Neisseria sp. P0020.S005]